MSGKLSKTILASVVFFLILIVSIIGISTAPGTSYCVAVHKFNGEPERYVLLENPDSRTLEAMNNDGLSAIFYSADETNIDELTAANMARFNHEKFYYYYNGSYYDIGLMMGDPVVYTPYYLVSAVASAIALVAILSTKAIKKMKKQV